MGALDFTDAFTYPFNRWQGLLNILWVLVPIYGWFLLIGYRTRIVTEFTKGKFKKLPLIEHGSDFKLGFLIFVKGIPGVLVIIAGSMISALAGVGNDTATGIFSVAYVIAIVLIVPMLAVNFLRKRTVKSCFELDLVKLVFKNFGDYMFCLLKELVLGLVFLIMYLVLVGIPANAFTKNIFFADFYRRHVK